MFTAIRCAAQTTARFLRNQRGSIALMTGVMLPVLALLAGGATDVSRIYAIQIKAQKTLDAAVLSMARSGLSDEEIADRGPEIFKSWLANRQIDNSMLRGSAFTTNRQSVRPGQPEELTATATLDAPTYFLGIFGHPSFEIALDSTSLKPNSLPYEISLVLDVSGSMRTDLNGRPRIERMQEAALSMLDQIESQTTSRLPPAISVIPYSTSVNLGDLNPSILEGASVSGQALPIIGDDVWAAERFRGETGSGYDLSDNAPTGAPVPFVTRGEIVSATPISRLQGPTTVSSSYRAAITGLTADGATAGHIGMIWGIYALSPAWSSVWSTNPKPYGEAHKVIVMLTDGQFNTTQNIGAGSTNDGKESNRYFQSACDLAKANGTTIYTVALSVDGQSEARLRACAKGSGGQMFSADSADSLTRAFEEIAREIGGLRLSS